MIKAAGYPGVPGIFTQKQIEGWKRVIDAVHEKGAFIYCKLWHVGRATTPSFLGGENPISSSDIPIAGNGLDGSPYAQTPPKPMTVDQIKELTADYAATSKRALNAGFDGVEIHSANGYLLDQFLNDNVNVRNDEYGTSVEGGCRFSLEVVKAVIAAIGADRVGMCLSPYNYSQDTRDSKPNEHWEYLCEQLASLPEDQRLSYVHMVEPRFDEVLGEQAKLDSLTGNPDGGKFGGRPNSLTPFRQILAKGGVKFLSAGSFNRDNSAPKLGSGDADAIVFGRSFIANPDLRKRLAEGLPLNDYDRATFYGADPHEKGYTDYTVFEAGSKGVTA
jgi:2,4-dienoyl-CoA reductase-like NADH-dependent reductase (Old Yellow Enzyme family)